MFHFDQSKYTWIIEKNQWHWQVIVVVEVEIVVVAVVVIVHVEEVWGLSQN